MSCTRRRVSGAIVVSRSCSGFISPRPLKRVTIGFARGFSASMRSSTPLRSRVVERVVDLLADVDAVERRHRDVDVAREHQRPEVAQEQRAEQRRDVQAVGVGVGEDADLVVAQARDVGRARVDAERDRDVVHFLRAEHLARRRPPRC